MKEKFISKKHLSGLEFFTMFSKIYEVNNSELYGRGILIMKRDLRHCIFLFTDD